MGATGPEVTKDTKETPSDKPGNNHKGGLIKRLKNDFTYHRPPPEAQGKFVRIRAKALELGELLVDECELGRELSTSLTKLEEAVFHANASIARKYPALPEDNTTHVGSGG